MIMKVRQVPQAGFTLVEIMIVVGVIGLLAVIAIPAFAQSRAHSAQNVCISNLRKIDDAKAQWAMDNRKGWGVRPRDGELFGPTSYIRTKPQCPAGGQYDIGKVKEPPTCTIPGHTLIQEESPGASTQNPSARDSRVAFNHTTRSRAIPLIKRANPGTGDAPAS
jgi:prepilin-type N-terminal cleavage/methylation domain-containing protein